MTQLLVLGLLKEKQMSGYDIQVAIEKSNAESWGGVLVGSIYHALKKLQKDGHIEVAAVEHTGRRKKSIYKITERGDRYFNGIMLAILRNSSAAFPTQLYSGLNFLDKMNPNLALTSLSKQKASLERELDRLQKDKIEKQAVGSGEDISEIRELVFEHMDVTIRQQIDFVDKIIKLIEK